MAGAHDLPYGAGMAKQDRPDPPDEWRVYGEPAGAPSPEPEPGSSAPAEPSTWVPDNTPPPPVRATRPAAPASRLAAVVIALALLLAAVGAGALILLLRGGDEGGSASAQRPAGFQDLIEALEEERGNTQVFTAVIYPEYAVVEAVVAEGDDKYDSYRWDGELVETSHGTSPFQPFDLADVDPAVLEGLCGPVVEMVGEVEGDCYLIVRAPSPDSGAWISAYASNKYHESGRIEYDLDGNEVARYEP